MKIYVAGPMRGLPEFNFPAFDQAASMLRQRGHEVFNPADHDRETYGEDFGKTAGGDETKSVETHGFDLRKALGADLAWIAANADAVAVLPGWEDSKGAKAEVALAKALGLVVAPFMEMFAFPHARDGKPRGSLQEQMRHGQYPEDAPRREVRSVSSTGGEKGVKPQRYDLIPPVPLALLAEHYGVGARKYADHQWRKGYEWSKSFAAMQRHAWQWWNGENLDAETGSSHITAVAWHAFFLLQMMTDHPNFDDRPHLLTSNTAKAQQ